MDYLRTRLSIGSREIQALRVIRPVALDLVAINGAPEAREDLPPLARFGPEVSAEPEYQRWRLALDGAQVFSGVDVTSAAFNSLLDLLEGQLATCPILGKVAEPDAPAADVSLASAAPVAPPGD